MTADVGVDTAQKILDLSEFNESIFKKRRIWIAVLILSLLLHILFFFLKPYLLAPTAPPRVEVQEIDQKKLEKIRQMWKEKPLLLDKDKNRANEKEAPKNARYMSDKNIAVEKEQRAKQTAVIPKETREASKPKQKAIPQTAPVPDLKSLGVPIHLTPKMQDKPIQDEQRESRQQDQQLGGDQALDDKNLPEGSENLLNTQESVYYSFYARIYQTVGPIWESRVREVPAHKRLMAGIYITRVDVVFDKDGNIVAVNRLLSSGIRELDEAVDYAWKRISRVPNPPKGLLDEEQQVHTGWTFQLMLDENLQPLTSAPSRDY